MVLCIIALPLFALLSLFSAKYRPYARASFDCVFRRLTLRPCNTGFEEQLKSDAVAFLLPRAPPVAKLVHNHFEAIGWVFTILMVASMLLTIQGVYNYFTFGTCDPANPNAFCPFRDLTGNNQASDISGLLPPNVTYGIRAGNSSSSVTVVEFGCFTCPYTKQAEAGVRELLAQRGAQVNYIFKPFPLPSHPYSRESALASLCAANPQTQAISDAGAPTNPSPTGAPASPTPAATPGAIISIPINASLSTSPSYWAYRQALFDNQANIHANGTIVLDDIAAALNQSASPGFDLLAFRSCLNHSEAIYGAYLNASIAEGKSSRLYATPTFFVNNKPLVGPIPYEQLAYSVDHSSKN